MIKKGIVCDLFGVLVHRDDAKTLAAFAEKTGSTPDKVKEAIENAGRDELKLGTITGAEFTNRLNNNLTSTMTVDEVKTIWNSTLTADTQMISLLEELSKENTVVLLSNLNEFDWEGVTAFGLDKFERVLSFEAKMKKPNPDIFKAAQAKTGLLMKDHVFIDDQQKNVNEAINQRMEAHQFTSFDHFNSMRGLYGL